MCRNHISCENLIQFQKLKIIITIYSFDYLQKLEVNLNFRGFFLSIYSFFSLLFVIFFMFIFKTKIHQIRKFWSTSMVKLIGADVKQIGKFNKDADVILLNHNSMLDVVLLDYLHPKDIAWVANEKLTKVPVFGWIFKLTNLIIINPRKPSSVDVLITRIKEELSNNRPIGIFPEGTRGDNDKIIRFKKGIKNISEDLNLKIQPIVLLGTQERLDTKTFKANSGEVKVIYLDTIESYSENWYKELENEFNEVYKKYKG